MDKTTCLQCEKRQSIRGLCRAHYAQFNKAKKKALELGVSLREFEEQLVKKGLLLPDQKKQTDAYEDVLEQMIGNSKGIPRSTPDQNAALAKEAKEDADKLRAKTKPNKKTESKKKATRQRKTTEATQRCR